MNGFISNKQQQLKQSYIQSMTNKRDVLEQHYDELKKGNGDSESLYHHLHKLSGSAGMYGFVEISKCARVLMKSIESKQGGDCVQNAEIVKLFADLFAMMKNVSEVT